MMTGDPKDEKAKADSSEDDIVARAEDLTDGDLDQIDGGAFSLKEGIRATTIYAGMPSDKLGTLADTIYAGAGIDQLSQIYSGGKFGRKR